MDRGRTARHCTSGALVLVLGMALAVMVASGASGAAFSRSSGTSAGSVERAAAAEGRCTKVGKGHLWRRGGKRGSTYTIEGDRPSACAVGIVWLYRLTNVRDSKGPPGWGCPTASPDETGFCNNGKTDAVFTWTYRPR